MALSKDPAVAWCAWTVDAPLEAVVLPVASVWDSVPQVLPELLRRRLGSYPIQIMVTRGLGFPICKMGQLIGQSRSECPSANTVWSGEGDVNWS